MIDIHNHIIWGVDDGAKTIEDSIEMAKIASEDGIHKIVATPHFMEDSFQVHKEKIIEKIDTLNLKLKEENIDVEILKGNEAFITVDILEKIEENKILSINNSKYILVEFPLMNIPQNSEKIINNIMKKGYRPVIAHPERINSIVNDPSILIPFIEMGCITQITSGSILGLFGEKIKKTSKEMITRNMVYIIGSDAHNTRSRKPKISRAYSKISELTDEKNVKEMKRRSVQIIFDKDLEYIEPEVKMKKKSFFSKFFK
ncbi:MAG: CpsB/CapC family capsule biosynthesis tyrosine phosphatase [Bacillota bacterium]|nr:CpsB/CapC family capsule biosynthesis tyrosine phosphatase [Bacillota bacterium]